MNKQQIDIATEQIKQFHEYKQLAEYICREDGPQLIETAIEKISLRELGRRTGLSSTYLSAIKTKRMAISAAAFLLVANAIKELTA